MALEGLVSMLTELGLSNNNAKVYLAMLDQEGFTAAQAAAKSGVPRQRVYHVLSRLEQLGLCMEISSNPRRFTTTDPKIALKELLAQRDERLNTIRRIVPDLSKVYENGRQRDIPLDYVRIIRDITLYKSLLLQMHEEAEHDVISLVKPPYSGDRSQIEQLVAEMNPITNKRKLNVRVIYEMVDGTAPYPDLIERAIEETGEQARLLPHIPLKATVIDGKRILLMLPDSGDMPSSTFTQLYTEHPHLSEMLRLAFDSLWESAIDYRDWKQNTQAGG